jgi:hypothetical protein
MEPMALVARAIASIHKHEPNFPVIVIADGGERCDLAELSTTENFEFIQGERLKILERGAEWWHRFFVTGLSRGTPNLLKFDPDSVMWRAFRGKPSGDHYGTPQSGHSIQGGCEGFSREFAERIVESKIALDPRMQNPNTWSANGDSYRKRNYLSTDWTMEYIARTLGVKAARWNEIRSQWRSPPPNHDERYAVTHPHKWPK